jgi:hypothetical protein
MSRHVSMVVMSVAFVALAVAPASAVAGRSVKPQLAPAAPHRSTPIRVTWKAKNPKRGTLYTASLSVRNPNGLVCSDYADPVVLRATRNGFKGTLGPQQWCPGSALVTIQARRRGELASHVVAGARVTITIGPGERAPSETPAVPTKVTILPGSTLTAMAAGRPDRSTPLTGTVRGFIPGRFKPNTDIQITNSTGVVTLTAFAADPLCQGESPLASIDTVAPSKMVLFASGAATFDLTLNASASQVFGCGPSGAPAGTTTLPLTGKVGPKGLLELALSGAITGVPLPGGSTGGLAANLIINVDLSGKS